MLFSQIYGPSQEPRLTEDQARQMRINRWGADTVGPRDAFSEDYSDKFNTVLAPDEEEKYQAWATENHREKDVYDYDLRGAWKELQSGTMSEDERGHLGDKYKKPNHPTFSDQSIYSGQGGVVGGVWSRNAEGKDVYTPGRKLSSVEADRLRRYFLRNEPGVVLDLKDKVFEERSLPGVNMPLGVFSGLGDTWKGIPAAVLQTASSAITAFKNTGADVLSRMGTDETRAWWEGQKAVMDQNARDIREYNKVHFEVDPETMGTASQIVYGLFKTLPKAMGYGLVGGVAGGALAFGADVGIDETNRLMDEGVDRDTAINAGLVSFGMNAIGMRLPAVLGASRGMSMAYGAAANAGTNVAEVEGIKFILEHQDYNQLAQQYDLNAVDLAVSAAMGAAFGGAFWRSPEQIRTQKYQDAARLVYEDQRTALFNKGKSQFNFEQAGTQAAINARAVVSLAKRLGIEPDKVRDFSAKIVWSEDGKTATVPEGELSQIIGQEGVQAMDSADKDWTRTHNWYTALEMEDAGKTPEEVYAATGWERGADGEWRYEIPDVEFKPGVLAFLQERAGAIVHEAAQAWDETFNRTNSLEESDAAEDLVKLQHKYDVIEKKLSDLVDAPELFKAYPELKDMVVEFGQLPEHVGGYFDPSESRIRLSYGVIPPDGNPDTQSTLAHEIQHAIQQIEGFAGGANPESMKGKGRALFLDMGKLWNLRLNPVWKEYQSARDAILRLADPDPEVKEAREKLMSPEEIQAEWERAGERERELAHRPEVEAVRAEIKRLEEKYGYSRDVLYAINHDLEKEDPVFKRIDESDPDFKVQAYKRVAGEVEARNVQHRLKLNSEQRKSTPLRATESVPRNEQTQPDGWGLNADILPDAPAFEPITVAVGADGKRHRVMGVGGNPNLMVMPEGIEGIKPLPVRLQEGTLNGSHIRKHEQELRKGAGYQSVEQAIWDICQNWQWILKGTKEGCLRLSRPLLVQRGGVVRRGVLQVEFQEVAGAYRIGSVFLSDAPIKKGDILFDRQQYGRGPLSAEEPSTGLESAPASLKTDVPSADSIGQVVGKVKNNNEFYQVAYHGSPYLFDKFSLDHVGEGVRAQWYGWGMYFSLDKNVARQYASNLYNASGEARDRYNRLSAEAERLQHELSAAEESGDMAVADSLRAQWTEAKAAVDKALPDHPRVYDAEIPEDSVMVRAATTIDQQPEIVQQAFRNLLGDVDDSKKGRALYNELAKKLGSKKAASEALRNEGVLGLRYSNSMDGECAVVWDDKAIEIREFLQEAKENGKIRGSFNPQTNTIKLTPNANLSTFSHEHSHWYLTNLFAHAADENISPEARADIDALLKAFGLKSVEEYNALPFEQKVKLQEQYAAWTERYLAEGEVPAGYLKGMFRNFARWLMDMYRDLVGEGAGDDAAKKEIGERYKAQFGEELPELSQEVRRVLDRMYDAENKMASFRSNSRQVTAARVIQAQRTNNQKVTAPLQDGSAPEIFTKALRAQEHAAEAMNSGEQVDVSQTMKNVPVNDAAVRQAQNAFAKSFQMGDTGTIVVLQNRDRTGAVSVGQMNTIATAPDYTRLSVSRTTDSGAPIVSYGTVPDSRYLGNTETVADGGHKIPMTYAVVEADSVLRSNNFDGTPVPEYGTDPSRMHAIAGNGRMAGLSEAYNRGTAEQYRQDLMADAQSVGINPEVVAEMRHPVLVRIMTPEEVTTGFIERSNSSNVLEKSALETAVQDSPRIRNNVWKYQFDEDGAPTPETVRQFTIDIGEPNSLGKLLTADGRPTETATNRLRAAVFYEAYRDRTLTALVADDTDKQGIKRILNAMAAFAPHVINIREASNGAVDLGPILVDVVNRIRNAKIEGTPLESIIGQGDVFGDNPAVQQLLGFIAENQNSAAAIARVFEPFAAAVENRLKSSGNGPQGGLFGEAENVSTDLADVMGIFRDTQNRLISETNAAMRESGATEGFREALPAVDVETMRNTLQALTEAQRPAEKVVESVVETVTEKTSPEAAPEASAQMPDVETQQQAHQTHEQSVFSENSDRVQVESLSEINPDMVYEWQDDDGNTIQMTARDVLETDAAIDAEANKDMAAMGTAAMCIYRNNGITE